MGIPDYMHEQIERRFNGRFRLRWSEVEQMYLFEQKVRRGLAEGMAPLSFKNGQERKLRLEDVIRARDGYILTMQISPGTSTRCRICNTTLAVPAFKTAQIACPYCAVKGRTVTQTVGYFPISDSLLDELEWMDNEKGGDKRRAIKAEQIEARREAEALYKVTAPAEAAFRQDFNKLVGIPQKGMNGKVYRGTNFANFKG
jgi:hypothetical protein